MGSGAEVLKAALVEVRRALKQRGFSAKGTIFYRRADDGNTVVLSAQKSVKSSPANAEVTLNYGVYSARLGDRLQDDPSSALDVTKAHWRKRLAEGGREKWLHVRATDSAAGAGKVILDTVEGVLLALLEHASDEALRDEWLSGSSPGLTDMQRLLFGVQAHQRLTALDGAAHVDQAGRYFARGAKAQAALIARDDLARIRGSHGAGVAASHDGPYRPPFLVSLGLLALACAQQDDSRQRDGSPVKSHCISPRSHGYLTT